MTPSQLAQAGALHDNVGTPDPVSIQVRRGWNANPESHRDVAMTPAPAVIGVVPACCNSMTPATLRRFIHSTFASRRPTSAISPQSTHPGSVTCHVTTAWRKCTKPRRSCKVPDHPSAGTWHEPVGKLGSKACFPPAEIRGSFKSIATQSTGFRFGEHLPRLARHNALYNVVRSAYMDTCTP